MDQRISGTEGHRRHRAPMNIGDSYHGLISGSNIGGQGNTNTVNINNFGNAADLVLEFLERHTVTDAFYNSGKREEEQTSICHVNTHTRILGELKGWARGAEGSVCWLRGPAGTGKSTIAHTIADNCDQEGKLAATFFFSRGKGDREDINKLVPTLVSQIVKNIPQLQEQIWNVLKRDRTILSLTLKEQFSKLIVEPLNTIQRSDPWLIIIDGLDECSRKTGVVELTRLIGQTMANSRPPLLLLLTSRPETDIFDAFQSYLPQNPVYQLTLEDSVDDVRNYLRDRLGDLRQKYRSIMKHEPVPWPSTGRLEELVIQSQGLFIYASTLVQYVGDGKEPPQDKLRKASEVHAGVDPLYIQVLTEAQQHSENSRWVIGSLMYHRYPVPIAELPQLLRLDIPNIRMALDRCHSVLAIPDDDSEGIRPHHASLRDCITSRERSQVLFCGPAEFHAKILVKCLKAIADGFRGKGTPDEYACIAWYHHCSVILSQANMSQDDFRSLCRDVNAEVKNLNWVWYWMSEALFWAGVPYLIVDLPSAAGMCTEAKALHITLEKIRKILQDFMDRYGGRHHHYHLYYYGYYPRDIINKDLNDFFCE